MKTKIKQEKSKNFNELLTLFKIQFKERKNLDFKKKSAAVVFFSLQLLIFGGVFAAASLLFNFFKLFVGITGTQDVLSFITLILTTFFVIFAVSGLMKCLYSSSDNLLLFSFPVSSNNIFISKILVYLALELISSATFLLPVLLAYGLFAKAGFLFVLMSIIISAILPFVIVSLSALLSIPFHYLSTYIKNSRVLSVVTFIVLAGTATTLYAYLMSNIGTEISFMEKLNAINFKILNFISRVVNATFIFKAMTDIIYINAFWWLKLLIMILLIGVFSVAAIFGVRPFFFKMATRESEQVLKKNFKPLLGKANGSLGSSIRKEFLLLSRSPDSVLAAVVGVVLTPIVLYAANALLGALALREAGKLMVVAGNILIISMILLSGNRNSATGITKEGKAFYLTKSTPVTFITLGYAKISIDFILSSISLFATAIVLITTTNIGVLSSIFITIFCLILNLAQIFISFENDLKKPITDWYDEAEGVRNSTNVGKSQGMGYLLALVAGIVALFVLMTNSLTAAWIKLLIMAVAILIFRIFIFNKRVKYYYQDIEL